MCCWPVQRRKPENTVQDARKNALAGDLASQIQMIILSIIVNLSNNKKIKSSSSVVRFPVYCNKK